MAITTPARQAAEAAKAAYQQRLDAASDRWLSEHHARIQRADAYTSTQARLRGLRGEHQAQVAWRRRDLEQRVFSHPDEDALRSALNIAVARITNAGQAAAMLRRAERTGDDVSAHAVFVRASELGYRDVVSQYTATRPHVSEALGALRQHDLDASDAGDRLLGPFFIQKPPGLEKLQDGQIAAIASQANEPVPSAPARKLGPWSQ